MRKTIFCLLMLLLSSVCLWAMDEEKIIDSMERLVFSVDVKNENTSLRMSGFYVHENGLAFTSEAPFYDTEKGKVDFSGFSVFVKSVAISKRKTEPAKSDAGFAMFTLPALKDVKAAPVSKTPLKEGDPVLIIGYSPNKHSLIINHNTIGAKQESVFRLQKPIESFFTGAPVVNLDGEIAGFALIADENDLDLNLVQDISSLSGVLEKAAEETETKSDNTERVLAESEDEEPAPQIKETTLDGYTFMTADGILLEVKGKGGKVKIPTFVEYICEGAFDGVAAEEIVIPSSVKDVEFGAFAGSIVEKISVNTGNKNFVSRDGVLFTKDKKMLICYPSGKNAESYVIEKGVEALCDLAFSDCKYLRSLTAPLSLTLLADNCILDVSGKLVITGYADSALQQYAEDHDIKFKVRELTDTDIKFMRELAEKLSEDNSVM
ncbi:MAG: leucine-rich repeat protein [Abditibacteriota bacterium]|nr:leucine-rich repeat protein [Abditibacteriota bacterium]